MLTPKQILRRGVDATIRSVGDVIHPQRLPSYFHGGVVWLDRDTWETAYLRYESYMASAIKEHLPRGGVFYDVGAHWGLWSVFAARVVGAANVFSFEPSEAFEVLEKNTEKLPAVTRFQAAVSNREGEAQFFGQGISSSGSLLESITELSRHYMPETPIEPRTVPLLMLDSVFEKTSAAPALVKIDVEGNEWAVLDGARELVRRVQPTFIIEIHPGQLRMCGTSEEAVFELLGEFNYAIDTLNRNPNTIYTILARARSSGGTRRS